MRILSAILCVVFATTLVGCGGTEEVSQKVDVNLKEIIKTDLQAIEKSGRLGSGFTNLKANVNGLKKSDPALGDAIEAGLNELMGVTDAAKIKAKAKEILAKL